MVSYKALNTVFKIKFLFYSRTTVPKMRSIKGTIK